MTKKFFADGATGRVVIYEGEDDVIANPLVAPERVHFHSDLGYFSVLAGTASVYLPLRNGSSFTVNRHSYILKEHNFGYKPAVILIDITNGLPGNLITKGDFIQKRGTAWQNELAYRMISPLVTDTGLYLQEDYFSKGKELGELNLTFRYFILKEM